MPKQLTTNRLILATAIFLVCLANSAFFRHVASVYPLNQGMNAIFLASLAVGITAVTTLLLALLSLLLTTRLALALMLLLAAPISYFANNYNVVIDHLMIQNILQTNTREAFDLFSPKLLLYLLLLGIGPAMLVCFTPLERRPLREATWSRLKLIALCVLIIPLQLFPFSRFYASFFREHENLRWHVNPTYALYSFHKYVKKTFGNPTITIQPLGTDAHVPATNTNRELIIVVVGEAARADRFSLNGYHRDTNPLLSREEVISYPHVASCDTSTATSVPCMFSDLTRAGFSNAKAKSRENLLDVAQRAGVNVLWRENNSDSKEVALRVPYEDFQSPGKNPACEGEECRDEGMLVGLQEYIDAHKKGAILIVLHQMGNHGPAYYKRYPKEFERFGPVCRTNQLDQCSQEEIGNAYDNALLYTDYFLSKVIALLKNNDKNFETAMLYMGDHGESLGELGVYLHGMPYVVAPEAQTHIPALLWLGNGFRGGIDEKILKAAANGHFSHDNLFHTVLGLMEIQTTAYNPKLDIVHDARREPTARQAKASSSK